MLRFCSIFIVSFLFMLPSQNVVLGKEPGLLIFGAGIFDMFDDEYDIEAL